MLDFLNRHLMHPLMALKDRSRHLDYLRLLRQTQFDPPEVVRARQLAALKVTLKASDATPLAGKAVRLFGVVKPAQDGRKLHIQRRLRNGKFKTIATTRLHAARGDKSTYSLKLRLAKDAVLRARVPGDTGGVSGGRKLDVHRAA